MIIKKKETMENLIIGSSPEIKIHIERNKLNFIFINM